MLEERGLTAFDAFVHSAKLKHSSHSFFTSLKQLTSKQNHAWVDKVFYECATIEVGGHLKNDEELAKLTSHHTTVQKMKEDESSLKNLADTVRKERTAGFLTCKNCRSTKVDVDQVQTRSADEPMTLFALCQDCGHRWTMK